MTTQAAEWKSERERIAARSPRTWALWVELCEACDIEKILTRARREMLEAHRDQVQSFLDNGGEASPEAIEEFRRVCGLEAK